MSKYELIDYSDPNFKPSTLVQLLQWRAFTHPDDVAYTYLKDGEAKEIKFTYGELDRYARAIAATLQKKGLAGERALLLYPPGLEYITGFFGCLYAGIIAVPAYPPDPNRLNRTLPRLQGIIRDAQATLALTNNSILHMVRILKLGNKFTESLDKVPFLRKFRTTMDFFSTKGSGLAEANELGNLQWISTDDILSGQADTWKNPKISEDTLAFLQYTSGSTGIPKGVMLSHKNLLNNSAQINQGFGYSKNSHGVIWLPIYHDMGLIGGILQPLFGHIPATLMSPIHFLQQPIRWLQTISGIKDQSIISGGPNFAYDLCVKKITPEQLMGLDLSHWDVAFTGAEPVRHQTLDRFTETFKIAGFRKDSFLPCYGLAEATLFVTGGSFKTEPISTTLDKSALSANKVFQADQESQDTTHLISCGTPPFGQEIAIVNPDSFEAYGEKQIGEIWIKGINVAQGYWNRSDETKKTFHAYIAGTGEGPFLRTGDLGFLDSGNLYVTGRVKDLIIIRGRNYYPQDIEYLVENSHPEIRPGCSAAFSIEKDNSERLIVVAEVRHTKNINVRQITDAIRLIINETFEIQTYSIALIKPRTIPKTSSGKIQRHACKNEYEKALLKLVTKSVEEELSGKADVHHDLKYVSVDYSGQNEEALRIKEWLTVRLAEALEISEGEIEPGKPFASYGLDSAQAVGLVGELEVWLKRSLSPTLIWDYPDILALADHLASESDIPAISHKKKKQPELKNEPVAIIGYGLRMPGANNSEEFWKILKDGMDVVTEIPSERWRAEDYYDPNPGTPGKMITKNGGFISGVDQFDAHFFGISPKEAVHMDPQQRLLLESTWEAFESAGLNVDSVAGSNTGVFIGISTNDYSRLSNKNLRQISSYSGTGNALSLAANRISYTFDFRGPSLSVDTACSSSLTAIHNACRSLRQGDSDMFIAGGVNLILSPEVSVTLSQARMLSASGRCRSFDENADGYVRGEGCGVVLLKRLSDAIRDHDPIHAVIRGSAVNQDGRSNGITAPKGLAQQEVMRLALEDAGVRPEDIDYLESHSTGTAYGDPIEIDAIIKVLAGKREMTSPLIIGSVKTNIGHLEAASGIAAIIKTILALKNSYIPRHLHLNRLNPHIKSGKTPITFTVSGQEWPEKNTKRLAGISSFGIGGTNAHLILENAPEETKTNLKQNHLLTISAKSTTALDKISSNLADFLLKYPNTNLSDLDYTLNTGRKSFNHRRIIIYQTFKELTEALNKTETKKIRTVSHKRIPVQTGIGFLFEGKEYSDSGLSAKFYEELPEFRKYIDHCCDLLKDRTDSPVSDFISGKLDIHQKSKLKLEIQSLSYLSSFIIQYAFARLLIDFGMIPEMMAGYESGEYLCAHLAGVISLEDSLNLTLKHSEIANGTMNSGGTPSAISDEINRYISGITLKKPVIKYISSLNGQLITPEKVADPDYLLKLLTDTGRSGQIPGILSELQSKYRFVSFGSLLSKLHPSGFEDHLLSITKESDIEESAELSFYRLLGKLWLAGKEINWSVFYRKEIRNKISLPTYPFERQRYWIDHQGTSSLQNSGRLIITDHTDLFRMPVWKQSNIPLRKTKLISAFKDSVCLVIGHQDPLTRQLEDRLLEFTSSVITVHEGKSFKASGKESMFINPLSENDFRKLFTHLSGKQLHPSLILYNLFRNDNDSTKQEKPLSEPDLRAIGPLYLAGVLKTLSYAKTPRLGIITDGMAEISGHEEIDTTLSLLAGLVTGNPAKNDGMDPYLIDLDRFDPAGGNSRKYSEQILSEFTEANSDRLVAYRGRHRWTRHDEAIQMDVPEKEEVLLRDDSTYLIAGRFDKSALRIAEKLVNFAKIKLILLTADTFPSNENRDLWLESHDDRNEISRQIKQIRKIEKSGVKIKIFNGNLFNFKNYDADIKSMGPIRGFIFCDIEPGPTLQKFDFDSSPEHLTNSLKDLDLSFKKLRDLAIENGSDFCVTISALSRDDDKYVGGAVYSSINHYIDSFSALQNRLGKTRWISINLDTRNILSTNLATYYENNSEESADALLRVLALDGINRVKASLNVPESDMGIESEHSETQETGEIKYSRPELATNYIPPKTELEKMVVASWQNLLGIQPIGVKDDFFDLGGNSLLGTQLIAQVREQFNIELPFRSLFADPTISGIAKIIDSERNKASQKIDKVASLLARIENISDQQAAEMLRERKNNSV